MFIYIHVHIHVHNLLYTLHCLCTPIQSIYMYVCVHLVPPAKWHEGVEEIETECVEASNSTACGINGPV